jgi:hypothetical protein
MRRARDRQRFSASQPRLWRFAVRILPVFLFVGATCDMFDAVTATVEASQTTARRCAGENFPTTWWRLALDVPLFEERRVQLLRQRGGQIARIAALLFIAGAESWRARAWDVFAIM